MKPAKLSSKNQIAVPRAVREKLGVGPGESIAFEFDAKGVRVVKAAPADDPFATFSEWSSAADDDAYKDL